MAPRGHEAERPPRSSSFLAGTAQFWALVLTPSPTALFPGQAKRNREHWFDELPRTAFLIFKGKVHLNMASGQLETDGSFQRSQTSTGRACSEGVCVCVCVCVCVRERERERESEYLRV